VANRFQRLELEGAKPAASPGDAPGQPPGAPISALPELHDSAHWMHQAERARRRGDFEEGLRLYSRAVEADRANIPGWVGQARMLIALEEYPEAEMWSKKALELFRDHPELTAARAQALCRVGDMKTAMPLCDAAISKPGQSPYPWIVRGDLMLARRSQAEAHCFDMALQLNPDWPTLIDITETYLFYNQHAKSLTRIQQALAKAPDQAYCWYLQGICQLASGMDEAGRKSLRHCLDLEPRHPAALRAMAAPPKEGWLKRFWRS
jgi:tetratricopeptide (TPR) repeat protein